jgi:hypothetical protein
MKACVSCKELDGAQAETPPHARLSKTVAPLYAIQVHPGLEYFVCSFCLTVLSRPSEKQGIEARWVRIMKK